MNKYREELMERIEEAEFELLLDDFLTALGEEREELYQQVRARGEIPEMPEGTKERFFEIVDNFKFPAEKKKCRHPNVKRYLLTAVITCFVLFTVLISVQAAGVDVFGTIGRWTDAVLFFGNNTTERIIQTGTPNAELEELYEILSQNNIPLGLVPSYLPENYSSNTVDVLDNGMLLSIYAKYINQEDTIVILVDKYYSSDMANSIWFEKDSLEAEEYQPNEMLFYVFSDQSNWLGVWQNGEYSVCIQTSSSKTELLSMLNTIEGVNDD